MLEYWHSKWGLRRVVASKTTTTAAELVAAPNLSNNIVVVGGVLSYVCSTAGTISLIHTTASGVALLTIPMAIATDTIVIPELPLILPKNVNLGWEGATFVGTVYLTLLYVITESSFNAIPQY